MMYEMIINVSKLNQRNYFANVKKKMTVKILRFKRRMKLHPREPVTFKQSTKIRPHKF